MKTTHFGLQIKENEGFDSQNIAARLFICPRISPEYASRMIDMLVGGSLSVDSLINTTNAYIEELSRQKQSNGNISKIMNNKVAEWRKVFGAPSAKDYDYIEKTFGFSQSDILGKSNTKISITAPIDVENYLKTYVKGQDRAIKKLAVPFFLFYESDNKNKIYRINRPVLLIGPTGSGKTYMLQKVSDICDFVYIYINLSTTQPAGWKGNSINDKIADAINSGRIKTEEINGRQVVTSKILLFGDEFDKIPHYNCSNFGDTGNASDRDLQSEIMNLTNKDNIIPIQIGVNTSNMKPIFCDLPTNNMLCVFAGAFTGIEKIIGRRLSIGGIGYNQELEPNKKENNLLVYTSKSKDLKKWGFIKELLGRIGTIAVLNPITADIMYEILTTAEDNILSFFKKYFSDKGIDIQLDEESLRHIAEMALQSKEGVRGLESLLINMFNTIISEFPSKANTTSSSEVKPKIIDLSKEYIVNNINTQQFNQ